MRIRRVLHTVCRILTVGCGVACSGAGLEPAANTASARDDARGFTVLHISDMHISPHLTRTGPPGAPRGAKAIRWVGQEAGKPQEIDSLGETVPAPAFALATGDLTEYGVIDDTWDVFEKAFAGVPCRMFVQPGNHDNTWVAMYHVMRERHGGENYSFDHGGIHFACISSASPQEPVPSIDGKTREWLLQDLLRLKRGTPVILALHHPLYSTEFASAAEMDTLLDMLRDHNIVLVMYGHGHGVTHRRMAGISGVMGGSTFGKNAGYGILSIADGRMRYAYRFHLGDPGLPQDERKPGQWRTVMEKPLPTAAPSRLFSISEPTSPSVTARAELVVRLKPTNKSFMKRPKVTLSYRIDGEEKHTATGLQADDPVSLPIIDLPAGDHVLTVVAETKKKKVIETRSRVFHVARPHVQVAWIDKFPTAFKAGPVLAGRDLLVAAGTDGVVRGLDKYTGQDRWSFRTGGEILGTPAWMSNLLVFGSGDGHVYAVNEAGKERWRYDAGLPVYGWPVVRTGVVYIGDNGGRLHALNLHDGAKRWVFERADYAIESKPVVWGDQVVFGAWDGYVYAVGTADGKLRWKSRGPKSSLGKGVRYYAPADCGPIVVADQLYVCDRGYMLGSYTKDGRLGSTWTLSTSGITPAEDGRSFYSRATDHHLRKHAADGTVTWDAARPCGRLPIPPTECGDHVYVCSNSGLMSVLSASTGELQWQYQASPGFYVMAPVVVDRPANGRQEPLCFVADMDGRLTAVRHRLGGAPATRLAEGESATAPQTNDAGGP